MKTVIIIPARFKSKRFPGKPIKLINNIPMVVRVAKICKNLVGIKNIYIATDNLKIKKIANKWGFKTIITSKTCLTGTDRVAEASLQIKADIYINVQGDEPTILTKDIKKILDTKKKYYNHVICGYCNLKKNENPLDTNIPKVCFDNTSELIYISRNAIPFSKKKIKNIKYFKQVCIYAFNKKELKIFKSKKKTYLEKIEDIEILRFLEKKQKVKMVRVSNNSIAVDQPRDIKKVEKYLNEKKR